MKFITNEKAFLKDVKKDFPEFIDDDAILQDAESQLSIGNSNVEFINFKNNKKIVKLYNFDILKNGKRRYLK